MTTTKQKFCVRGYKRGCGNTTITAKDIQHGNYQKLERSHGDAAATGERYFYVHKICPPPKTEEDYMAMVEDEPYDPCCPTGDPCKPCEDQAKHYNVD